MYGIVTGSLPANFSCPIYTTISQLYERDGYRELTVSALLTNLLDCLLCASAPLIYLASHIDQLDVIPVERQIKMLDNVAYIMPGLENFKS